jgi:hypothetical protein
MINVETFEAEHPGLAGFTPETVAAITGASVSTPQLGQVWRLTWADVPPRLGVVVLVGDCYVHIVPLTLNLENRVDAALVLEYTPLHLPLVAWPQLRTGVGDFVLAECFGKLDDRTTRHLTELVNRSTSAQDLTTWNTGLTEAQVTIRRGYRDRVLSDFAAMGDSDWSFADLADRHEEFLIQSAAQSAGLTLRDLSAAAGMSLVACFPMWEGTQPLPDGLGDALVRRFGNDLDAAIQPIPTERKARVALDAPEWREGIIRAARSADASEADTRRSLYRELVGAPGRERGDRNYRETLKMLLDARTRSSSM